ncbi:hypothetical protein KIPE111705_31305 [Kibdelosporangium persicum]
MYSGSRPPTLTELLVHYRPKARVASWPSGGLHCGQGR